MGRYIGSVCKLCRRERVKLYLKGDRCFTAKCPIEKKKPVPGVHGAAFKKMSEYGAQLREKQKVKRFYFMYERNFHGVFERAAKKKGKSGEILLQMLELRLDNVVFRMGLAPSRRNARQTVGHGHIAVNGRRLDIPSSRLKAGDVVTVREGHVNPVMQASVQTAQQRKSVPDWLDLNAEKFQGKVLRAPDRADVKLQIDEQQIVELYSK